LLSFAKKSEEPLALVLWYPAKGYRILWQVRHMGSKQRKWRIPDRVRHRSLGDERQTLEGEASHDALG